MVNLFCNSVKKLCLPKALSLHSLLFCLLASDWKQIHILSKCYESLLHQTNCHFYFLEADMHSSYDCLWTDIFLLVSPYAEHRLLSFRCRSMTGYSFSFLPPLPLLSGLYRRYKYWFRFVWSPDLPEMHHILSLNYNFLKHIWSLSAPIPSYHWQ